ncbi:MAG: hypothetical protein WD733_10680 [Bryobacterales bacterium]
MVRIASVFLCLTAALLAQQSRLPQPVVTPEGVVNAASFQREPLAPGSIISIFGTNLGLQIVDGATTPISEIASQIPLATSLGGHSVVFSTGNSEVPAPMFFVSGQANQINAQVPWELAGQQNTQMTVRVNDGASVTQSQPVPVDVSTAGVSPGIFTFDFGPGRAAAINVKVSADDDVINGSFAQPEDSIAGAQPAPQGGYIIVFVNGMGPVNPPAVTGNNTLDGLRTATQTPTVTVGGLPANVQFSGLAPEFVGLYQINMILSDDVPPGDQVPIRINLGGALSRDDVTIAVRAGL